jgi:hypothetical protein
LFTAKNGGIELIIQTMKNHCFSPAVQMQAIGALWNLVLNGENQKTFF